MNFYEGQCNWSIIFVTLAREDIKSTDNVELPGCKFPGHAKARQQILTSEPENILVILKKFDVINGVQVKISKNIKLESDIWLPIRIGGETRQV